MNNLEQKIKDFIQQEMDYFQLEDSYWYLFNSASKEQEKEVLELLQIIKKAKDRLEEIQEDIYYN